MALSTAQKDAQHPFPRTAIVTGPSNPIQYSFSGWEPKKLWVTPLDGGRSVECAFAEGFDSRADGRSLVSADLDGDGDLDLLMRNRAQPKLQFFENEGPPGQSVEVVLKPESGSPEGEGAQVVESGRVFPVLLARGYASGVDPIVHIGLGERKTAKIEVRWRSGKRSSVTVAAGRRVRVTDRGSIELLYEYQAKPPPPATAFPTRIERLGISPMKETVVVQLFISGCKPCIEEVPLLKKLGDKTQLVSLGLHDASAIQPAATAMGIGWQVGPLPHDVADSLSTAGALPLPLLFVYRRGFLERIVPSPRLLDLLLTKGQPR